MNVDCEKEGRGKKEMEEEIQALEHPLHVKDNVINIVHMILSVYSTPSSFIQQSVPEKHKP